MPLNALLLTCLVSGCRVRESGVTVSCQRNAGETVLFFSCDDQANRDCELRNRIGLTGRVCDVAAFYHSPPRSVICLVELKRGDVGNAVDKLINTKQAITRALGRLSTAVVWKACVVSGTSSPSRSGDHKERLRAEFGGNQNVLMKSGRKADIGILLRGRD
jgi:hypothetical protein